MGATIFASPAAAAPVSANASGRALILVPLTITKIDMAEWLKAAVC